MGACCNGDTQRGPEVNLTNRFQPIDRFSPRDNVTQSTYHNIVERTIQNIDVIEGEIAANQADPKWKQIFEEEYQKQHVIVKGMFSMGQIKGKFNEDYVKSATLMQMKKDGVLQNAINWVDLADGKREDPGDVIG